MTTHDLPPTTYHGEATPEPDTDRPRAVRTRRLVAFRASLVFAALLPTVWLAASAASLVAGGPHAVHDLLGAGVLLELFWLGSILAMWRAHRHPRPLPLLGLAVVAASSALAAALSASNAVVALVLVVQAGLVALTYPDRRAALAGTWRLHVPGLVVTALIAGPLLVYATTEAALQASGDAHAELAHYFDQAWYALLLVGWSAVAAVRADLRRAVWAVAAAGLAGLAAAGLLWPTMASSPGRSWGLLALAAAAVLALVAARPRTPVSARGSGREVAG